MARNLLKVLAIDFCRNDVAFFLFASIMYITGS